MGSRRTLWECNECLTGMYNYQEHHKNTKHISYSKVK